MAHETNPSATITEQASYWWVVFRDGGASAQEQRRFREWVVRSPERVEAYLRIARLDRTLDRLGVQWPDHSAEELRRAAKAAPAPVVTLASYRATPDTRRRHFRPGARGVWAMAATVLVAVVAGWYALMQPTRFESALGELRSIPLRDSSRVTLNSSSKIEVRLGAANRVVHLIEGEALFDVAHDASRPFDVITNHAVVRAIGTSFDVYQQSGKTTITVVGGRVAVFAGSSTDSGQPTLLGAGDRLAITAQGKTTVEHGVDLAAATGWTRHELIFQRRPLGEIAEEFNRYNRERLEIRSPELRARVITGTFRSNDAGSFISFLEGIPGVRVENTSDGDHIVTLEISP
jgi:transmembrane sensor